MDTVFNKSKLYEKYIGCSNDEEHATRRIIKKEDCIFNIENEINIQEKNILKLKKTLCSIDNKNIIINITNEINLHEQNIEKLITDYRNEYGETYKKLGSCERYRFFKTFLKKE